MMETIKNPIASRSPKSIADVPNDDCDGTFLRQNEHRANRTMKYLTMLYFSIALFSIFSVYFCLQTQLALQPKQQLHLEEQIQELQVQMKKHYEYLKKVTKQWQQYKIQTKCN